MRFIPVFLPTASERARPPVSLMGVKYVDFRERGLDDRGAMRKLIRGILSEGR